LASSGGSESSAEAWVLGLFRKNKWMFLLTAHPLTADPQHWGLFAGAAYLGGDAVSGRIQDGHYFLFGHGNTPWFQRAVFKLQSDPHLQRLPHRRVLWLAILIVAL